MKSPRVNTNTVSYKIKENNVSQTAFNGEVDARASADDTLQSNIDSEASARQSADETLQDNIDAESATRAKDDVQKTAGVVVIPTRTDASDGTSVTIGSDGIYALYPVSGDSGVISRYSIAGNTFPLTDGTVTYIVADYNSGSPILRATTNREEINAQTIIPVVTIERVGTNLHELYKSKAGVALAEKIHLGVLSTDRFKLERGGLVLGASGQNVTITSGVVWQGLAERVPCAAFNSSTNRFARWVKTSGTWAETVVTTWENTYYQGASGQVALQNSTRYAVTHVGRTTGDDVHAIYVLGTGDYTLAEAVAATLPADLPPIFNLHCVYVGKIIAAKGATTATYVMAPITTGDYAPLNDMSAFAPLDSPAFTGTPTAPTATAGTNTTQIATTAFVASSFLTTTGTAADSSKLGGTSASSYALLNSPALTGNPTAPTASAGTSTTQIATTAFVATSFLPTTTNYAGSSTPGGAATTAQACTGNAATATALATARTLTIGATGKTFDGSANVTWTVSDIGPDIGAIEALTGTSGLLRKTAADTWSLDTSTYATTENGTGTASVLAEDVAPTGVTYTATAIRYRKLGTLCICELAIKLSSLGTGGSGRVLIGGFPYTSYNYSSYQNPFMMLLVDNSPQWFYMQSGSTRLRATSLAWSSLSSTSQIVGIVTYTAAS